MEVEEWRPVVDYEGYYEVSNFGNVRSVSRRVAFRNTTRVVHARAMVARVSNRGYPFVKLRKEGEIKHPSVHRLVAKAYLPPPSNPKAIWVDHIDRNRTHNAASNLRWATPKENRYQWPYERICKNCGELT